MTNLERFPVRSVWARQRSALISSWLTALLQSGILTEQYIDLRELLANLLDQAFTVLESDIFAPPQAHEIGAALAVLGDHQPQVLGVTVAFFARELSAELEYTHTMQQRMALFLGELSQGFVTHAQVLRGKHRMAPRQPYTLSRSAQGSYEGHLGYFMTDLPLILFSIDCDGIIRSVSGAGLRMLHVLPEHIIGSSIVDVVADPQVLDAVHCALSGQISKTVVPIGSFMFETRYAPLCDAHGQIAGVAGVAMDVTERQEAEHLREREQIYRRLIEHIPAITYIAALDDNSSTIYTSPQIESVLGFSQADWMADSTLWLRQIHPDDRSRVLDALERSRAGKSSPCEYRMFTRSGQVIWLRDESALMCDDQGRPLYLYGVMLDITERRNLEAELTRVRQRLVQTQEDQRLRIAVDLHDGPVQQLLAMGFLLDEHLHVLMSDASDAAQRQNSLRALESVHQGTRDIALQLRQAIGELRPAGLDALGLSAALAGYIERLRRDMGDALPKIELHLDPHDGGLPADVARCLFRVAQEAVRNAVRHAGAKQLIIRLAVQDEEVRLDICDDGCGFEVPAQIETLALSDHFGLAGLVEQVSWAGGHVDICSQLGAGTCISARIDWRRSGRGSYATDARISS